MNSGLEFEYLIQSYFEERDLFCFDTPMSNDYGADLLLQFEGKRIAIQCKYYSRPVGVDAVREVVGAIPYYNADVGLVVSNQPFTRQARALARVNNVLLVGGSDLDYLLDDLDGLEYLSALIRSLPKKVLFEGAVKRTSKLRGLFSRKRHD